jgi:ABC-2 type transport system permease protein
MASNSILQAVNERGWQMGMANLLHKENGAWWRTWRWAVQTAIWLVLLNGLLATILWAGPAPRPGAEGATLADAPSGARNGAALDQVRGIMRDKPTAGLLLFLLFNGIAVPIAVVIAGQDAIIGEKQSGTAAWVLSKPVSRSAFVLSKMSAYALGSLATAVVLQGAVAYAQIWLAGGAPRPLLNFAGAMGLLFLNLMFYFTLTLMLGTFFAGRGAVLGISLALLLGYQLLLAIAPGLAAIMPWGMVLNVTPDGVPLTFSLAVGRPLSTITPIVASAVWCVIFVAIAIWRFRREEF